MKKILNNSKLKKASGGHDRAYYDNKLKEAFMDYQIKYNSIIKSTLGASAALENLTLNYIKRCEEIEKAAANDPEANLELKK